MAAALPTSNLAERGAAIHLRNVRWNLPRPVGIPRCSTVRRSRDVHSDPASATHHHGIVNAARAPFPEYGRVAPSRGKASQYPRPNSSSGPDPVPASDPDDGRNAGGGEKRKRWREHKSEKKRAEMLGKHMIPVVLGPDQHHYIIDHHHLARALHDEGVENVLVTVIGDLTMVEREAFWTVMDHKRWAYPYDVKGERRRFKDLPKSVTEPRGRSVSQPRRRIAPHRRLCQGHHALQRIPVGGFFAPQGVAEKRG